MSAVCCIRNQVSTKEHMRGHEISPKTSAFFGKYLKKPLKFCILLKANLLTLDTTVCVGDSDAGIDPSFVDINPTTLNIGFSCQIQDKRL